MAALSGCDPAKVLQVRSVDKPNYSVSVYANGTVFPGLQRSPNDKVMLTLPLPGGTRDTSFHYGIGGWSDPGVKTFASHFDSIIIVNNGVPLHLVDQVSIIAYLQQHRQGSMNALLMIESDEQ